MRITTGTLGGRVVSAPKTTATRPMMDRVRAALFDALGDISGSRVLDAYAGSGAIGFEALSRGAASVIALESGRVAAETIRKNQAELKVASYQLLSLKLETWLNQAENESFDLIIADPPYDHLQPEVISRLGQLLVADGRLVLSHSSKIQPPALDQLQLIQAKTYGDTALSFYQAA